MFGKNSNIIPQNYQPINIKTITKPSHKTISPKVIPPKK